MPDGHGKLPVAGGWLGAITFLLFVLLPFREVLFPIWPAANVFFLAALGGTSLALIWGGEYPLPRSLVVQCLIAWMLIQLLRAPDWDKAFGLVEAWGSSFLLAGCCLVFFRRGCIWRWVFVFGLWGLATFISVLNPSWQIPFDQMEQALSEETLDPEYRDAILHAAAQQRFHFPFGNPIDLGVFLSISLLAVPFFGCLIRKHGSSIILWSGLAVSAGLQLFVLWGTRSRTPLLGLLAGILVQVIFYRGFSRRSLISLVCAGVVLITLLVASPGGRAMLSRTETVHARLIYWEAASRLARMEPLLGAGIGGYGAWYPSLRGLTPHQTLYPHNILLEVMTDTGAVGLLLFVFGVIQLGAHFFKNLSRSPENIWRGSALACFFIATLVGFHHNIAPLLALAAIIAVLPANIDAVPKQIRASTRGMRILWGIGIGVFILLASLRSYSHVLFDQASQSFQRDHDAVSCRRNLDRSLFFWPPYPDALSYRAGLAAEMRNLASAEKDLKAALSWSPQTAYLHDQLADVYAAQGKKEQALNEVRKAVALHPVKWSYHEHASRLLFQLGRKEQAREERLKAEALKPFEPQYGEALKASLPSADSR